VNGIVRVQTRARGRVRVRWSTGDDRGAGAVLALAIVAAVVVIGLAAVGLAGGLAARQRVIGASDLAALAGADAASGAVAAGGARLASCRVDGLVVDVAVVASFSGIALQAHSRAGPPP
jgi:hypothetical protein